jgi:hypothetical protein
MKKAVRGLFLCVLVLVSTECYCWGFYGHKKINYQAVFLLPPGMMVFYKKHVVFLTEHAVDPDKRRYAIAAEGPRHYIDLDRYGPDVAKSLPRKWSKAVEVFTADSLQQHGIVPWWIQIMQARLTTAFKEKNAARILKLSAEIGHYIADAHVPLHASSNHNGQLTGQHGIHGFWESRIPELFAESRFDFVIGKAEYISDPLEFIWARIYESGLAADTVLQKEKELSASFAESAKYAFEERNGVMIKQYSTAYTTAYQKQLNDMVERRMRQSIYAVAAYWYTAWVNAGQPDLTSLSGEIFSAEDLKEWDELHKQWLNSTAGERSCTN